MKEDKQDKELYLSKEHDKGEFFAHGKTAQVWFTTRVAINKGTGKVSVKHSIYNDRFPGLNRIFGTYDEALAEYNVLLNEYKKK